mmetsp:Transcript_33250/g.107524  ORF Transcript_33250/g.107524 Transcript_33250/m.107524 type:complete len:299 (+) Transcript_33250:2451-3347(+)
MLAAPSPRLARLRRRLRSRLHHRASAAPQLRHQPVRRSGATSPGPPRSSSRARARPLGARSDWSSWAGGPRKQPRRRPVTRLVAGLPGGIGGARGEGMQPGGQCLGLIDPVWPLRRVVLLLSRLPPLHRRGHPAGRFRPPARHPRRSGPGSSPMCLPPHLRPARPACSLRATRPATRHPLPNGHAGPLLRGVQRAAIPIANGPAARATPRHLSGPHPSARRRRRSAGHRPHRPAGCRRLGREHPLTAVARLPFWLRPPRHRPTGPSSPCSGRAPRPRGRRAALFPWPRLLVERLHRQR